MSTKCSTCGVIKDKDGKARCPYCNGLLCKDYPSGRKCINCSASFPGCKCGKCNGSCGGCTSG